MRKYSLECSSVYYKVPVDATTHIGTCLVSLVIQTESLIQVTIHIVCVRECATLDNEGIQILVNSSAKYN